MKIVQQVCRRTSNSHSWHQLALQMMYMSFLVKAFFGASGKSLVTIVMPTLPGLPTTTLKTQPLLGGCAWRWAHESQEKKEKNTICPTKTGLSTGSCNKVVWQQLFAPRSRQTSRFWVDRSPAFTGHDRRCHHLQLVFTSLLRSNLPVLLAILREIVTFLGMG